MNYILGVDGGGTKTLALLGDLDGNVLSRGVSGPSNYNAIGFDAACSALEDAIQMAHKDFPGEISALCLGLAGAGRSEEVNLFQNWTTHKFPTTMVKIASDAEILLMAGAPSGPALALVCGTGSIVYGRTITGEFIRAGGWGYLFGDEGSGFAIGSAALRAVMWAFDGRGPRTLLSELVLDRYGLQTPSALVPLLYGATSPRSAVAGLSDLVEQAAQQADPVALTILDESARDLARTIAAIYPKLEATSVPLIITGGMILNGKYLQKAFHQTCETQGLIFSTVRYVTEPAEGALQLARKLLVG